MLPGTVSGELTFLSAARRNATVIAERDSVLWRLRRERWNELEKDERDAAREATRILIRIANEEMDVLIVRPLFVFHQLVSSEDVLFLFSPLSVSHLTGQLVYDSLNWEKKQKERE
jgi:CRP-like cAMP-binding protein